MRRTTLKKTTAGVIAVVLAAIVAWALIMAA
jgi:hypothetical protein